MTLSLFVSDSFSAAAIASQIDVKKGKTDASKHKPKTPHATTTAPRSAVSALLNTPTPQPRATGLEGRDGPIVVPAHKNDSVIISEYDLMSSA